MLSLPRRYPSRQHCTKSSSLHAQLERRCSDLRHNVDTERSLRSALQATLDGRNDDLCALNERADQLIRENERASGERDWNVNTL